MIKAREKYLYGAGAILGGLVFLSIYGAKILDPAFIEWRMHGDAAQHFLGWHFFRSEPWHFPLGLIKSFQYPHGTSVVYTDSIPFLTIPLKLFSPLLPDPFQYCGLWLLCCYILQGYFASLLLGQVIQNPILNLLGTFFFLLSPTLVHLSLLGHESQACHWLILASLYLYFQADSLRNKIKWVLVMLASAMIHFYLLVMVIIIWMGYLLKHLLEGNREKIISVIKFGAVSSISTLLAMWVAGYFVIDAASSASFGFDEFSMNLLAPINPAPYQFTFLNAKPLVTYRQEEGFNYLGFGMLLLLVISSYEFLRHKEAYVARRDLPLTLVALILFMLALSNKITLAHVVLFEADLPDFLDKAFNIIRASGRMFWPVSYLLMLAAMAVIVKYNKMKSAALLFMFFGGVQVVDFLPWYRELSLDKQTWQSPLKSDLWNQIAEKINHIVFVPAVTYGDDYVPFSYLAANHKKTINAAYLARTPDRTDYTAKLLKELKEGKIRHDALYIIREGYFFKPASSSNSICGFLDGYAIIAPKMDLPELAPWPMSLAADDGEHTLKQLLASFSTAEYAIILSMGNGALFKIPQEFVEALQEKGSHIEELQYRGSYAAIILNGRLVSEKIDNGNRVEIEYMLPHYKIKVVSAGMNAGNPSFLVLNDFTLPLNRQGFNVIVLALDDDKVARRYIYNPDAPENLILTSK